MAAESVHSLLHHFTAILVAWGLRDYGIPPSIWGGAADCEHKWGEDIRSAGGSQAQGATSARIGRSNVHAQEKARANGAFCQRCGAWLGALGLEPSLMLFVEHIVEVFREVRRVLRKDGTLWLNLGDSYATGTGKERKPTDTGKHGYWENPNIAHRINGATCGLKPKDLCGIPWRVALALQADGWWLRQDIIYSKANPMPESVTDRCTKSHEYMFLLSKSERYYFDAYAIAEPAVGNSPHDLTGQAYAAPGQAPQSGSRKPKYKTPGGWDTSKGKGGHGSFHREGREDGHTGYEHKVQSSGNKSHKAVTEYERSGSEKHRTKAGLLKIAETAYPTRNKRSVWTIATQPFPEAHFATFPTALVEPCILAGCRKGGTVLDPFFGAGTTGLVADRLGRDCIGIEINPEYIAMAERRLRKDGGMLINVQVEDETPPV